MSTIALDEIQPRFIFVDPASGKRAQQIKNVRARSAIVVVGSDALNRVFVLDAWADRVGTNEIVSQLLDMTERWEPQVVAFEAMGQQSLLTDPILSEARRRQIHIPLSAVTVSTKIDKRFRIRATIQPAYGSGRLIIDDSLIELINEVTQFPMSPTLDLVDALASAIGLVPPQMSTGAERDDAAELAAYLRQSGVSMSQIEARMAEVGGYGADRPENTWTRLKKILNTNKING